MSVPDLKTILWQLLRFETTHDRPEQLAAALDYIESLFTEYPVVVQRFSSNGKPSLVITQQDNRHTSMMLNGHVDVVPAPTADFQPRLSGRKLFARGASDMKGSVAALIVAYLDFLEKDKSGGNVGLMLTSDEEVGGEHGVKYLLDTEGFRTDFAFVPDGGGDWDIDQHSKGAWHIELIARGQAAHGSRPWLGENAAEKVFSFVQKLSHEFDELWGKLSADNSWRPTINLGKLESGTASNLVPDRAVAQIDIRYPEQQQFEAIQTLIAEHTDERVSVVTKMHGLPLIAPSDHDLVQRWSTLAQQHAGITPRLTKVDGASDARFFAEYDIPVLLTKSAASEPHIDGEWIDWEDLKVFTTVVQKWLR